ncbi:MAG: hypothetical protein RLZZ301_244 [Bacteroidota bacterium]|jgi:cell wall-associated NlpC family hydrolase
MGNSIRIKIRVLLLACIGFFAVAQAQDLPLQQLEKQYQDAHYKRVYIKAGFLASNPSYSKDPSLLLFKSMAVIQCAQQKGWYVRHTYALNEARTQLIKLQATPEFKEKSTFIKALEPQVKVLLSDAANPADQEAWRLFYNTLYPSGSGIGSNQASSTLLIAMAQKQIGVPYKSAGTDPSGFDCSGLMCYLFQYNHIELPRRASDQYAYCLPISAEEAQPGDLVFFTNGTEVNHVGLLISEKGMPKRMIHASSSSGIIETEIESNSYWKTRIAGYGRVPLATQKTQD